MERRSLMKCLGASLAVAIPLLGKSQEEPKEIVFREDGVIGIKNGKDTQFSYVFELAPNIFGPEGIIRTVRFSFSVAPCDKAEKLTVEQTRRLYEYLFDGITK